MWNRLNSVPVPRRIRLRMPFIEYGVPKNGLDAGSAGRNALGTDDTRTESRSLNRRILFLHIPRSGGTSLHTYMKTLFSTERTLRDITVNKIFVAHPEELKAQDLSALRDMDYIHGHFGYNFVDRLGEKFDVIANFRHPATRIASMYFFWKNNFPDDYVPDEPGENGPALAKSMNFSEFIRHDSHFIRCLMNDAASRQLLSYPDPFSSLTPQDLATAKARVDSLSYFYVVEFPELSEMYFEKAFGFRAQIPNLNASYRDDKQKNRIGQEDLELILESNRFDLEIYLHALTRLFYSTVNP